MDKQYQDIRFENVKREEAPIVIRQTTIRTIYFHPSIIEIIYLDHIGKECTLILPKLPFYKLVID